MQILLIEIEKSFCEIKKHFCFEDLEEFRNIPQADVCLYHFGLGTWIRNNLLHEKDLLYQSFVKNKIYLKDDMSDIIINSFHAHVSYEKA